MIQIEKLRKFHELVNEGDPPEMDAFWTALSANPTAILVEHMRSMGVRPDRMNFRNGYLLGVCLAIAMDKDPLGFNRALTALENHNKLKEAASGTSNG